jgi:hypothetical protein
MFSFDDVHSLDGLSDRARKIASDILAQWKADSRTAVSRKTACDMLGVGATKELALEQNGEIDSFLDGPVRRITTASIYRRQIRQAIASHPVDGGPTKARQPSHRFVKKPRPRTESELRGLAIGNERRKREAEARRVRARNTKNLPQVSG